MKLLAPSSLLVLARRLLASLTVALPLIFLLIPFREIQAAEGPLFTAAFRAFDVGIYPFAVAIGDLDGDGMPDLAVANSSENSVSVLMGNGDGSYEPKTDYGTGVNPRSVAIGELNGDGRLDLVVGNWGSTNISVFLGMGDGTFGLKLDIWAMTNPTSVAIADLNADGRADLVVANEGSKNVLILGGNGDGRFYPAGAYRTDLWPMSVAIGDLNGDGKPDLVVANRYPDHSTVSVLLGNGDVTFHEHTTYSSGLEPYSVAIGDLNGDGKPDLAVANAGARTVSVLLGRGDGGFDDRVDYGDVYPFSVAIGDFNRDGMPDLAVANDGATVSVLLGIGAGTFGEKVDYATAQSGGNVPSVAIADLNSDGKLDMVAANGFSRVSILLGNGDGTFGTQMYSGAARGSDDVASGDLNSDGIPDLVMANHLFQAGTLSVMLGRGDGTFEPQHEYGAGSYPRSVAIADLNTDGKPDLVAVNEGSSTLSVLLGNGDGTFGLKADFPTGIWPVAVAVGDFNGDGKPDVATANEGFNRSVSILLGDGDGTFGAMSQIAFTNAPISIATADLNEDGRLDLAVGTTAAVILVLLGNGDGTFGPANNYPVRGQPWSVAIGDLNGDGTPDLAVANLNWQDVTVLLGSGGGTFGAGINYVTADAPNTVCIGDLDGDGIPDLAASNGTHTVSVLLGRGDGTFGTKGDYGAGFDSRCLAIQDLNGDGMLDLAVGSLPRVAVSVLLNRGSGQTATLLSRFEAEWVGERVEVRWQFGPTSKVLSTSVERSGAEVGPWTEVNGDRRVDGGGEILADGMVEAGQKYFYRLNSTLLGGQLITFGPVSTTGDAKVPGFVLVGVAPSLSVGAARVTFLMPHEAQVRISVLDVLGRRIALLTEGVQPAGRHEAVWDANDGSARAPAGLYFVRFEWPGGSATRRLTVAR